MKERPILFSAPMVRAILEGRKTQTRRVLNPQPIEECGALRVEMIHPTRVDRDGEEYPGNGCFGVTTAYGDWCLPSPFGAPGNRLWVRESGWQRPERSLRQMRDGADTWKPWYFDADLTEADHEQFKEWDFIRRPSIFMPHAVCRVQLEITGCRVERLQDISSEDCAAEGIEPHDSGDAREESAFNRANYSGLWDSLNAKRGFGWLKNPWVWVIEFKRAAA